MPRSRDAHTGTGTPTLPDTADTYDVRIIVYLMCANTSLQKITMIFMMIIFISSNEMKINFILFLPGAYQRVLPATRLPLWLWKDDRMTTGCCSWCVNFLSPLAFFQFLSRHTACSEPSRQSCGNYVKTFNAICVIKNVNYFSYAQWHSVYSVHHIYIHNVLHSKNTQKLNGLGRLKGEFNAIGLLNLIWSNRMILFDGVLGRLDHFSDQK